MGFRIASQGTVTANGLVTNGANVSICMQLTGINPPIDNATVLLLWDLEVVTDLTTTNVFAEIYNGPLTSPSVYGIDTGSIVPGQSVDLSGVFLDHPGIVAELTYTLAVTCTGAGSNLTVYGDLVAVML